MTADLQSRAASRADEARFRANLQGEIDSAATYRAMASDWSNPDGTVLMEGFPRWTWDGETDGGIFERTATVNSLDH
jgi:hypothetical protein